MIGNLEEIDPNAVAAIFYRPKDDVDRLLADFVQDLARQAVRVDGIVQRRFWQQTVRTYACSGRCDGARDLDLSVTRQRSYVR
nr:DUF2478 domain-containing protein [Bradyrhizobium barranii]